MESSTMMTWNGLGDGLIERMPPRLSPSNGLAGGNDGLTVPKVVKKFPRDGALTVLGLVCAGGCGDGVKASSLLVCLLFKIPSYTSQRDNLSANYHIKIGSGIRDWFLGHNFVDSQHYCHRISAVFLPKKDRYSKLRRIHLLGGSRDRPENPCLPAGRPMR